MIYLNFVYNIFLLDWVFDLTPNVGILSFFLHGFLDLDKKMLLRPKDRPRPGYSNPTDKIWCVKLVMFHSIASYQATCTTKPCLTVYCYSSLLGFNQLQKLINDIRIWGSTVCKYQIMMFDSLLGKACSIIGFIIKSYNHCHAYFLENRHIVCRGEHPILWIRQNIPHTYRH